MSSILKTSRTFLNLQLSSFFEFLFLILATLITGMLFWTNVYVAHALSVKRLAEDPRYFFDLNQALIHPHVVNVVWVLAIAVPILSTLVIHRSQKLIFIKSTAVKTLFGKYLAVLSFSILIVLPSSLGFLILQLMKGGLDSGRLASAFLGVLLATVLFAACSIFFTIADKNRKRAFLASLLTCGLLWLAGQFAWPGQRWLPFTLIGEFSRGILDIKTILIYTACVWIIFSRTLFYVKKKKSKSNGRIIAGLAVIALLLVLPPQFLRGIDLSETNQNFLSKQTEGVLKQFGRDPILITAFLSRRDANFKNAENVLQEYAYLAPGLQYKLIDPDQNPEEALENRVDSYGTTVVEAKGKKVTVSFPDENRITAALAGFLETKSEKRIIFAIGHDEPSFADKNELGYENLAAKIKSLRYELRESVLTRIEDLNSEDLILLAGPRTDLSRDEIEVLRRHFESGGSLLIAIDPVFPKEGERVRRFLWELGVDFGRNVMIDKFSRLQGVEKLAMVITDFGPHASIGSFNKPVLMPIARSVRKRLNVPDEISITEIARTGKGSWAETNLTDLENDKAEFNDKEDITGPVAVAAALEDQRSGGKMIVVGDSDWLVNSRIELLGNRDFLVTIVKWLMSERPDEKFVFRTSPSSREPFILSSSEHAILFGASIFFIPAILLIAGLHKLFSRNKL